MNEYPIQHYFPTLEALVGQNLHHHFGLLILAGSLLLSAWLLHAILNATTQQHHGFISPLLFMIAIVMLSPLIIMVSDLYSKNISGGASQYLGLLIASILLGAWPMTRIMRCSFVATALSVLPSVALWVMLVFVVRFSQDQLVSSGGRAESIRGRTVELDHLINP